MSKREALIIMQTAHAVQDCSVCACAFTTSILNTWPKLINSTKSHQFARCLSRKTCERKKRNTESTIYMTMTREVSSHKSSCLANSRLLHVSVHCCLVFVRSVQQAIVCACSQFLDRRSQYMPISSFFHSTARDTAPCVSRSNRFR